MKKKIIQLLLTFTGLLAASFPVTAAKNPGEIAENFTVKKRPEGTDLSLADYAGHVIMLDFFAYWCPPCQSSSPDVEENIAKYYQNAGGNQNGIPVTVIAVNIEDDNPQLTDDFIESAGLELVADDFSWTAYSQFSTGGIPLFVVINGVAGSPSHQQWEILHDDAGYYGASYYRNLIDSVEAPQTEAIELTGWTLNDHYPWVYSPALGWLYYLPTSGGLQVYHADSGTWHLKN